MRAESLHDKQCESGGIRHWIHIMQTHTHTHVSVHIVQMCTDPITMILSNSKHIQIINHFLKKDFRSWSAHSRKLCHHRGCNGQVAAAHFQFQLDPHGESVNRAECEHLKHRTV